MNIRKSNVCVALLLALVLLFDSIDPAIAATARATTMRLDKTVGTVTVKSLNGTQRKNSVGMRLFNGDFVETFTKSEAYISLDSTKAIKLAENSKGALMQRGKQLELTLQRGDMFFNVTKPLTSKETLKVRTSSMVAGVRGTCGVVEKESKTVSNLYLLEGKVSFKVKDADSGKVEIVNVIGGEKLTMTSVGDKKKTEVEPLAKEEIPFRRNDNVAKLCIL